MSWVWAATNVVTAKPVALKFLKKPAVTAASRFRRFLDEARATIPHRNVVRVYDLLYLEGDIPLSQEDDGERTVKVLDFGLAMKTAMDIDGGATPFNPPRQRSIAPFGTVGYAAPEQAAGGGVDHRVDIWALGVVLYECLAGERPFRSDRWVRYLDACTGDGRSAILAEESPLRTRVAPQLPESVLSLLARMLSPTPALRPSLHEVQRELQRYTAVRYLPFGEPVSSSPAHEIVDEESTVSEKRPTRAEAPAPALRPADGAAITDGAGGKSAGRGARWVRRSRVMTDAAVVSALALVVGLMGKPKRESPAIVPDLSIPPSKCDATITHTLTNLDSLAGDMPLTVEACSGPRSDCVHYKIALSPFTCDEVEPTGIITHCERSEVGSKAITIVRRARGSSVKCELWKSPSGEVQDKNGTKLRMKLHAEARDRPSAGPGVGSITIEGTFEP